MAASAVTFLPRCRQNRRITTHMHTHAQTSCSSSSSLQDWGWVADTEDAGVRAPIVSEDLTWALPASDNRITANWTWAGEGEAVMVVWGEGERGREGGGCIPPSYCISLSSAQAMCPAALLLSRTFTFCLENHTGELQLADPDWWREEGRERDGCQSERRGGSLHRVKGGKTDWKIREIKPNVWGKKGEKWRRWETNQVGATGSRESSALLHISANYNS